MSWNLLRPFLSYPPQRPLAPSIPLLLPCYAAGSTSPSLSTTASRGILSTDGKSRHNRRSSSEPQPDLPSGRKPDFGYDSEGGCFPSVRSPPKARVEHQHQRQPHYQIAPLAGFPTATSPLALDSARGRHNGNQLDESSPGEGDRKCDVDNNTPQACARESSNDRLCEADWPGGRGIATVSDAANPGETCARRQDMHTSRQERGQPSLPNVMHEKWGSVFVVGGGQRRRRTSVRRRSVETEDTPATRRAHVRPPAIVFYDRSVFTPLHFPIIVLQEVSNPIPARNLSSKCSQEP